MPLGHERGLRQAGAQLLGFDRKRTILLLRTVVIFTACYFLLTGEGGVPQERLVFAALLLGSNMALGLLPARLFDLPQFGPLLLLGDTALILFGLVLRHGLSQDLMLVYFFTIFLTTVGESLAAVAVGSGLISTVYAYWLWISGRAALEPDAWLRIPFFFLVAVFYASLTEQLKAERRRRVHAEHESQHLRLLLDLAGLFSETHATREFVRGVGRFIEEACPGLRCQVVLPQTGAAPPSGVSIPLRAYGEDYGELWVEAAGGRSLSQREQWLCQMVAHAAAGALYAAEQTVAARSAAEAKEHFLATISHELRTPLHAILGYAEILEGAFTPAETDPMMRDCTARLRVNVCRLQDLVEQVLAFAEIRAGQRTVRAEAVSMRALLGELEPVTREMIADKPVAFVWQVAREVDAVRTDRRKLRTILVCLLGNAAKFTDTGRITVTARQDARTGGAEIAISDTGIGIAQQDLASIFEDFRQLDGSITRRYGGLGLGLALVRELVTLLGGTLELESEPGKGTTVRVRIPRTLAGARHTQPLTSDLVTAPLARLRVAG